ncbi:unnamed protein product [Dicrocoelium dendriticum]|nr:unnamed protein product [Dicrocoelium dendriticum]
MYHLERIAASVGNITYTHGMYAIDPYYYGDCLKEKRDEETISLLKRLEALDSSVTHLICLLKSESKSSLRTSVDEPKSTELTKLQTPSPATGMFPCLSLVVQANPLNPPSAALLFFNLILKSAFRLSLHFYVHSNVSRMPEKLLDFMRSLKSYYADPVINVRIVWSSGIPDCVTYSDFRAGLLYGESMLLLKFLQFFPNNSFPDAQSVLVSIAALNNADERSDALQRISRHPHFLTLDRTVPSIADCYLYAVMQRKHIFPHLSSELTAWYTFCDKQLSPVMNTIL